MKVPPLLFLFSVLSSSSSSTFTSRTKTRHNRRLLRGTTTRSTAGRTTTVIYSAKEIVKLWATRPGATTLTTTTIAPRDRPTTPSRPGLPSQRITGFTDSARQLELLRERIFGPRSASSLTQGRPGQAISFPARLRTILLKIASQAVASKGFRTSTTTTTTITTTTTTSTTTSASTEVLDDIAGFIVNLRLLARNISTTSIITAASTATNGNVTQAESQVSFLDHLGVLAEKITRTSNLKTISSRTETTDSSTEQPEVVADIAGFIGNLTKLAQNISTPEKDSSIWTILRPENAGDREEV